VVDDTAKVEIQPQNTPPEPSPPEKAVPPEIATATLNDACKAVETGTREPREVLEAIATGTITEGKLEQSPLSPESISVQEVLEMVEPTGTCRNLGVIRLREEPSEEIPQAEQEGIDRLKPYLQKALASDPLLADLARSGDKPISQEQIRNLLGISDERDIVRLYYILNHNLDPALIPAALEKKRQQHQLPEATVKALRENPELQNQFAQLIADQAFSEAFFLAMPGGEAYPPAVSEKIASLIQDWQKATGIDSPEELQGQMRDFFNLGRKFWPEEAKTAHDTFMSANRLTTDGYFESKSFTSDGEFKGWVSGHGSIPNSPVRETLTRHAQAAEVGKYLVALQRKILGIYQRYLPEVYVDPSIKKLEITNPLIAKRKGYAEYGYGESIEEVNGRWNPEKRLIGIKSGTDVSGLSSELPDKETVTHPGVRAKRKVIDGITVAHEASHAIYGELVSKKLEGKVEEYSKTADHAINEGFSVLMELLMIDILRSHPEELGLDTTDLEKLEACKQGRLFDLKSEKSAYTEGTFRIFHKVYVEGAGKGEQRDMHQGLLAVRRFLDRLDPKKTTTIQRDSPRYLELLKKGNPQEWLQLFS